MSLKLPIQKNITHPKENINQTHNKYSFHLNLTNKKQFNTKNLNYNFDNTYNQSRTHNIIFLPYNNIVNYYNNCGNC
jgi:hypothetical protein